MKLVIILLLVATEFALQSTAKPTIHRPRPTGQVRSGATEPLGHDVILTKRQQQLLSDHNGRVKRRVDIIPTWPNAEVVYEIGNITSNLVPYVEDAIAQWEDKTCITFELYNGSDPDLTRIIFLHTDSGCVSHVGYAAGEIHYIWLAPTGCSHIGVLLHEIGHSIGLLHEHTRPDRNDSIQIQRENIQSGFGSQFDIDNYHWDTSIPYDVGSIMHYSAYVFSVQPRNSNYYTILTRDPLKQESMGRQERLSHLDLLFVNKYYSCSASCNADELAQPCKHGGFVGKNCQCVCPEGLQGDLCQDMTPSQSEGCGGHFTDDNGEIHTPGYPGEYPFNQQCNYLIEAPDGYVIHLTFDNFFIEEDSFCYWDQVYIRHDAPYYDTSAPAYCGHTLHGETLISQGNTFMLDFRSDDWFSETGFNATYTFVDTEDPQLACSSSITVSSSVGSASASVDFDTASVTDNSGEELTSSCSPDSGSSFDIGNSEVDCTASDSSGNTGSCSFDVTVTDTEDPQLTCSSSINVFTSVGSASASADFDAASVTDNSGEILTSSCSPASESSFDIGISQVVCTAIDSSENSGSCSFDVTVTDNEAPQLTCSNSQSLPADLGSVSTTVSFESASVSDNSGDTLTSSCSPVSGSSFDIDNNQVTCVATDSSGNSGSCSFEVSVIDAEAPALSCPPGVDTSADYGSDSTSVAFDAPSASDNTGEAVSATCDHVSGSSFIIGSTTVTCSATDAAGNTGTCTFAVDVSEPPTVSAVGECDGVSESLTPGYITSQNYPSGYSSGSSCEWSIDIPDGAYIYLWFDRIDVDQFKDQCYDKVTIKSSEFSNISCGQSLPEDVLSSVDVTVYFTSDANYEWTGFKLNYVVMSSIPDAWNSWSEWSECSASCGSGSKSRTRTCSGSNCYGLNTQEFSCDLNKCENSCEPQIEHTSESSGGSIRSPGYPFQYPKSYFISRTSFCNVSVEVPAGMSVKFTFNDLDLTYQTKCILDYLTFTNGTTPHKICGNDASQMVTFASGPVNVAFKSDNTILDGIFSRGFDIAYTFY